VVQQPLAGDLDGPGGHRLFQVQRLQGADAVRWQVHAGPGHLPAAGPLDHLGGEPGLAQRSCERQATKPGSDHQDLCALHSFSSVAHIPAVRQGVGCSDGVSVPCAAGGAARRMQASP
jgi:hypothetical protein